VVTTTVVEPACGAGRVDVAIRLGGEVGGAVDGHVVPVLATPRMARLLAPLVLEADVWVSREQLARELWPDSDAARAWTNLRKLLHTLRRSIPGPQLATVGGARAHATRIPQGRRGGADEVVSGADRDGEVRRS